MSLKFQGNDSRTRLRDTIVSLSDTNLAKKFQGHELCPWNRVVSLNVSLSRHNHFRNFRDKIQGHRTWVAISKKIATLNLGGDSGGDLPP